MSALNPLQGTPNNKNSETFTSNKYFNHEQQIIELRSALNASINEILNLSPTRSSNPAVNVKLQKLKRIAHQQITELAQSHIDRCRGIKSAAKQLLQEKPFAEYFIPPNAAQNVFEMLCNKGLQILVGRYANSLSIKLNKNHCLIESLNFASIRRNVEFLSKTLKTKTSSADLLSTLITKINSLKISKPIMLDQYQELTKPIIVGRYKDGSDMTIPCIDLHGKIPTQENLQEAVALRINELREGITIVSRISGANPKQFIQTIEEIMKRVQRVQHPSPRSNPASSRLRVIEPQTLSPECKEPIYPASARALKTPDPESLDLTN